jgi:hypothetical protein
MHAGRDEAATTRDAAIAARTSGFSSAPSRGAGIMKSSLPTRGDFRL